MTLADQIVVLRKGRIEQVDSPLALYQTPANLFVAGFIGTPRINLFTVVLPRRSVVPPASASTASIVARAAQPAWARRHTGPSAPSRCAWARPGRARSPSSS
ncbi:hypothetical protein [Variovorax sp. LjRoot175]|uniref:hypothetical protein n=1 Tax=Variovorax sp. LjRoot175 TaxID=3342276 RepID=UPI003F5180DC